LKIEERILDILGNTFESRFHLPCTSVWTLLIVLLLSEVLDDADDDCCWSVELAWANTVLAAVKLAAKTNMAKNRYRATAFILKIFYWSS
jgi:hypothetical protein